VLSLVDAYDAGDLGHQAEVAAGDPDDGADGFDVVGVAGIEQQAQLMPVVRDHEREVFGVQWLALVGEADPAIEMGVAGEWPVEAGHADQDQAEVVAVEEVSELFQPAGFQSVCFVDDHEFGRSSPPTRRAECQIVWQNSATYRALSHIS